MHKSLSIVLVCSLAFAMAGCSKKKADEGASATSAPSTTTTASGGSSGDHSTTTKSSDGSSSGTIPGMPSGDCLTASMAFAALAMAPASALLGSGMSQDDLNKLRSETEDLRSKIPAEIKDDFDVYAKAMEDYANALKDLNLSGDGVLNPDNAKKIQDATKILDDPAVKKAQDNIEKYFNEHCGT